MTIEFLAQAMRGAVVPPILEGNDDFRLKLCMMSGGGVCVSRCCWKKQIGSSEAWFKEDIP